MTVRRLVLVWAALLALLILTLTCASLPLGRGNALLSFAIAGCKATLVMAYVMHVKRSAVAIRLAALMGGCMLLILLSIGLADFASRHRYLAPWQPPDAPPKEALHHR